MRLPRLIVYGVTPERWARRWGIVPFDTPCTVCLATRRTSVPFAQGSLRGLAAPMCGCGNEAAVYCMVRDPRVGDLFDGSLGA